jgi:hypothetical protein
VQRLYNEGKRDDGQKVMQLVAGFRNTRTSLQSALRRFTVSQSRTAMALTSLIQFPALTARYLLLFFRPIVSFTTLRTLLF